MKTLFKAALIIAFGILIFFQIKSFATKNPQLQHLLTQREMQSLELEYKLSQYLDKPQDIEQIITKLTARYNQIIEDPESTRNDKLSAKESLALLKLTKRQTDEAYDLALSVLNEQPKLRVASGVLFYIANEKADKYINESQYEEAILEYQNLLTLPLQECYQVLTESQIAYTYYRKGDYDQAIQYYQNLIANHPCLSGHQAETQYKIAELYLMRKDFTKAKEELNKLIVLYPYAKEAKIAKDKLGEIQ